MLEKIWGRINNYRASREATAYLFKNFLCLGLQKPKTWLQLYYVYAVLMNLCVCVFLPISFTLSYIFEYQTMATEQLLTSLQAAFNVWGIPAKVLTMFLLMKRLRQAMNVMDILDARCERPDEYEKIRHCVKVGNHLTAFYTIFYGLYVAATLTTSVSVGKPLYTLYIPIMDWRNSGLEFAAQAFIEYMLVNLACLHQAADDVYPVIYVYVIRTHMQILVERVRRLGLDNYGINNDEKHYEELVNCVKDHQILLSLVNIISPVISITLFVQFTITAFILGTTLINIFIFADTSAQIASVVYLFAVLVQISPCCYQATCLIDDCDELSLAIFHCKWFDKDKRFRKLMIYFLMRSQTPITLTALKLFPITLDTSLAIAKFSFSLYTLIKKMDLDKHFQ